MYASMSADHVRSHLPPSPFSDRPIVDYSSSGLYYTTTTDSTSLLRRRRRSRDMYPVEITFDISNAPKHYTQGDIVKGVAHFTVPSTSDGKPRNKGRGDTDDGITFDVIKINFEGTFEW